VSVDGTVRIAAHALVCLGPRLVAALASDSLVGGPEHSSSSAKHFGYGASRTAAMPAPSRASLESNT